MPQDDHTIINIDTADDVVLCPLHVLMSIDPVLEFCFATSYRRDAEYRRIFCVRHARPNIILGPKMPVLFEVIGQIAVQNCYLTTHGRKKDLETAEGTADERFTKDPLAIAVDSEETIASCWIEPRPDLASTLYWPSVYPTVKAIMDSVPLPMNTDHAVSVPRRDEVTRLQVVWSPRDGEVSAL